MQYFFLDASGDPGFKLNKGSSRFYVQCLIITSDKEAISKKLNELRGIFRISKEVEFKYQKHLKGTNKQTFFSEVAKLDFEAVVGILDKKTSIRKKDLEKFGGNALTQLIATELTLMGAAKSKSFCFVLDETKQAKGIAQDLKSHISNEIKNKGIDSKCEKVRNQESDKDDCLQLADMIAGLIKDSKERNDPNMYKVIIARLNLIDL